MIAPAWAIRAFEVMQFKRMDGGLVKIRRIHKIFRPLLDSSIRDADEVTFSSEAAHAEFDRRARVVVCGIEAYLEEENQRLRMIQDDLFGVRAQIAEDLSGHPSVNYFGVEFDGNYDAKEEA